MKRASELNDNGCPPSLREGAVALINLYRTRLELLLLDLEEERERIEQLLIMAGVAIFLFGLGVLVATAFFVALWWEAIGVWGLLIFAALYLGAAGALVAVLRHRAKHRPRTFAGTLREFEKDAARFSEVFDGHAGEETSRFGPGIPL